MRSSLKIVDFKQLKSTFSDTGLVLREKDKYLDTFVIKTIKDFLASDILIYLE
jgi:hypothetical protein